MFHIYEAYIALGIVIGLPLWFVITWGFAIPDDASGPPGAANDEQHASRS